MTAFSPIKPKDIQVLQGIESYEAARRLCVLIRDSCATKLLLVCHVAKYFDVEEKSIILHLTGKS